MSDKKFPPQKVFFDGEFFDAFVQMKRFTFSTLGPEIIPAILERLPLVRI